MTRPIIVLRQPSISMEFFKRGHRRPNNKAGLIKSMRLLLARWRFDECGVTVLSHVRLCLTTLLPSFAIGGIRTKCTVQWDVHPRLARQGHARVGQAKLFR